MLRRKPVLTLDLIARAHPDPVADDESALALLTDEELSPGLARHLAALRTSDQPIWVFGYGSLLWQPEFEIAEQRLATLRGYHRRFCLLQRRFRGTPERPGLVLALERGGSCRGLAFRLEGDDPHAVLMPIWQREMKGKGYAPLWIAVETVAGPVRADLRQQPRERPLYGPPSVGVHRRDHRHRLRASRPQRRISVAHRCGLRWPRHPRPPSLAAAGACGGPARVGRLRRPVASQIWKTPFQ